MELKDFWAVNRLCLYCGAVGHFCGCCKVSFFLIHNTLLSAKLQITNRSVSLLLDSGVAGNFIVQSLVSSPSIPVLRLTNPIPVRVLDGRPLSQSSITLITSPVCLICPQHTELIKFYILTYKKNPGLVFPGCAEIIHRLTATKPGLQTVPHLYSGLHTTHPSNFHYLHWKPPCT